MAQHATCCRSLLRSLRGFDCLWRNGNYSEHTMRTIWIPPLAILSICLFGLYFLRPDAPNKGSPVDAIVSLADFKIEKIFQVENCYVIRFFDDGHFHYFSTCKGSVSGPVSSLCGKTPCPRPENIPTAETPEVSR